MNAHLKTFDIARVLYPGSKIGNANEFKNFVTKSLYPAKGMCKFDIKEVLPLLLPAIKRQIQWRAEAKGEFRPEWKGFSVWINDNYWEFEPPINKKIVAPKMCDTCGGNGTNFTKGKWWCQEHNPYKLPAGYKYAPSSTLDTKGADTPEMDNDPAPVKVDFQGAGSESASKISPADQAVIDKFYREHQR